MCCLGTFCCGWLFVCGLNFTQIAAELLLLLLWCWVGVVWLVVWLLWSFDSSIIVADLGFLGVLLYACYLWILCWICCLLVVCVWCFAFDCWVVWLLGCLIVLVYCWDGLWLCWVCGFVICCFQVGYLVCCFWFLFVGCFDFVVLFA